MSSDTRAAADAAYQGMPGAFSEDAALALLGANARLQPCPTLDVVFETVARGGARYAVVPVENTLAGAVPGCDDLIGAHCVHVVAERVQHIAHALIAPPGRRLDDIRRVLSHPVALAQCRTFLAAHPRMTPTPVFDTAGAVAEIMRGDATDAAAIASCRAASVHGAAVLASEIQDHAGNFTRFLMLEAGDARASFQPYYKTSLECVLPNEPGALLRALEAFAAGGLNLSRIESRPIRESPFEYRFYLDVDGSPDADAVGAAIDNLRACTRSLRILGHYAADDRRDPGSVTTA